MSSSFLATIVCRIFMLRGHNGDEIILATQMLGTWTHGQHPSSKTIIACSLAASWRLDRIHSYHTGRRNIITHRHSFCTKPKEKLPPPLTYNSFTVYRCIYCSCSVSTVPPEVYLQILSEVIHNKKIATSLITLITAPSESLLLLYYVCLMQFYFALLLHWFILHLMIL